MQQAAVIIGVSETASNQLQKLQAAISSARAMEKWAKAQCIKHVVVLTDENGPLRIYQIKEAIEELLKKNLDQLFVYFSGHGVNNLFSEYWLLSNAPIDPQEAVNVSGSADLARRAGVPHVVFISDACRTAADGIQAQSMRGSEIFPNKPVSGPEKPVDMFFAAVLGDPAMEIRGADQNYSALYTDVLAKGLSCEVDDCLERAQLGGVNVALVKPWPLKYYLDAAVPRRLVAAAVSPTLSQIPDARITSPPGTWLARKDLPEQGTSSNQTNTFFPPGPPAVTVSPLMAPRLIVSKARSRGFIGRMEERALASDDHTRGLPQETYAKIESEAATRAIPFGRMHFESVCGFKVQGAKLAKCYHPTVATEVYGPDSAAVWAQQPVSIVLTITDGRGVILPAIPEFVAGLTFEEDRLVNVVYEPADTSSRWPEYYSKIDKLRKLRGRIAAAARHGIFQPTGDGIGELARQMQFSKAYDPTMALYAAYAYHSIQRRDRIVEMEQYLFDDLQLRFFDLALLASTSHEQTNRRILPATPLLSQGWALLSARGVILPASLAELPTTLTNSLWSTFNVAGIELLIAALKSGDIE